MEGGRIMRWYGRRGRNVMRWQFGKSERIVNREGGMEVKHNLCRIALGKRNVCRDSLQRLDNSCIMLWIIIIK